MKKIWQLNFLILLIIYISSCTSQKSIVKSLDQSIDTVQNQIIDIQPEFKPIMASYNKHYKFTTTEGNIRAIERYYFGPQTDILKDFAHLESKNIINKEEFIKYPMASFFSETAIQIPSDKKVKAREIYQPLIDTLFDKLEKKSNIYIEILILGYTDFSSLDTDSLLFKEVMKKSQKSFLTMNDYYSLTSYYRSKEIATMISSLIDMRQNEFNNFNKIIIDIIQEGKGIEIPDSKREYESIDPKRRIAKVYYKITNL